MNQRKLVKSGTSSFIVALPIDWIRKNKLDKGSSIDIVENELGDLVCKSSNEKIIEESNITIKVNSGNSDLIYWELLRAYLRDFHLIYLEGENVQKMADKVIKKLDNFIGLDIIEQTKNLIVLKNFASQNRDTSTYYLVKKFDIGVRSMFDSMEKFFSKGFHRDDVLEIQSQNDYNNRFYLFALRLINSIADTPSLMRTFKTDYRELINALSIISTLNQLSFQLNKISKILFVLSPKTKEAQIVKELFDFLWKKYKIVLSLPKNSSSKDILLLLNESKLQDLHWESHMKELKNRPSLEIIIHGVMINNLLDSLSLKLIN